MFDIGELHDVKYDDKNPGSIIEVDYYSANSLLVMSDDEIVKKVKADLNTILGVECASAKVSDAAIVRLPSGVNWYFPGSYQSMPDVQSSELKNVFFAGDLVRTRHGSWSQEKAFVVGLEASNLIQGKPIDQGVIPLPSDELHVTFGRSLVSAFQSAVGQVLPGDRKAPSLFDFLF
ncbi:MAG: hypothetical protein SGILL_009023 [Bacillariaceae sp.]